jgi:hypothetical protein
MELEFTITEDEYAKANVLFSKPSKKLKLFYFLMLLSLVGAVFVVNSMQLKITLMGGMIGSVIGFSLFAYVLGPWKARKQYRQYKAIQKPVTVSLLNSGVFFKSNSGQGELEWSHIHKWRQNDDFVLIYQAPNVYHILPKRIGNIVNSISQALCKQVGNEI